MACDPNNTSLNLHFHEITFQILLDEIGQVRRELGAWYLRR